MTLANIAVPPPVTTRVLHQLHAKQHWHHGAGATRLAGPQQDSDAQHHLPRRPRRSVERRQRVLGHTVSAQRTLALRVATLGVLGVFIVVGHAHTLECPASIPVQQSVATTTVAPRAAHDRQECCSYTAYRAGFSDSLPRRRVFPSRSQP